jgi:parvulin-like peptidyl-prolyl isomerase
MLFVIFAPTQNATGQNPSRAEADQRDGVAARVNDKPIMLSEVDRVVNQQSGEERAKLSQSEFETARLQTLESLIERELLFQRAEKEGLLPTAEQVTAAINAEKQQSGLTEAEFLRELKAQNLTPDELREEENKDLAIKALQDKYAAKIKVTDREVEEYYHSNRKEFVSTRGVGLAIIAVDAADNKAQEIMNDAKGEVEAKLKIDAIFQQLKSGADFVTLARGKSEDAASAVRGGDVGFATEDDLRQTGFPGDLIRQFFVMSVGSFTAPAHFSSPSYPKGRWYIFKLEDRVLRTEALTLESPGVRLQISKSLINQRKEILNAALLTTARNEAKIVNYVAARKISNP